MKRVYVAGPISKPDTPEGLYHNVRQADDATAELMRLGYAVFNPMLSVFSGGVRLSPDGVVADANAKANNQFREFSHRQWLDMDFAWVSVSDAVLRLPGESKGADMETAFAAECGIPVFDSVADLARHFKGA